MTFVIRTVLLERFPEGLPGWSLPLLEGIQQLGVETVQGLEAENGMEEVTRDERTPSSSPLSGSSSMMDLSSVETEDNVKEEPPEEAEGEQTAEQHFRKAIMLSKGREALPYIWLAYLYMQSEDWQLPCFHQGELLRVRISPPHEYMRDNFEVEMTAEDQNQCASIILTRRPQT
ncbi:hypothetical protein QFC19_004934 [Naganishia cerealis]|uniref:Uncharacterized protein n=1 Tax=Naganishia cerealis TaxID=610337 RepID=A0ACC2VRF0_9TREE|nr:hypothetical protein QFC19_004934 [Naganishia cerealis]